MSLDRRALIAASLGASALPLANARAQPSAADPLGVRADFPITGSDVTFLNTAYSAPTPRSVIAAATLAAERKAMAPVSGGLDSGREIRERFARLINADPDEIGLVRSTGEGENITVRGLDPKPGDNVVMSQLNYDTGYILYRALEKELGIEFRIVPHRDGKVEPADIDRFTDRRTKLVTIALVSHQNGYLHDLKGICEVAHAKGAYVFADAVQAAGCVGIDAHGSGVDFLCANSYKWLLSTGGCSAFYVRRGLFDRLRLDRYGEGQIDERFPNREYSFLKDARRFEFSGTGTVAAAQFAASLAYMEKVGTGRILDYSAEMGLKLQAALTAQGHKLFTPPGNRSPVVAFYTSTPIPEARAAFVKARIDATARDGTVRLSPALFNTWAEVEKVLDITRTFT
jgi:selenocysteine lyase/cysteine desulfurase